MTKLDFYWQKNSEWWQIDDEWNYSLTPKAPPKAIESFKKYQEQIKEKSKDPKRQII